MFKKITKLIGKRKKLFLLLVVIVFVAGAWTIKSQTNKIADPTYTLAAVESGTISVSINGSGQVYGQDQIEITPEVSGKLTKVLISDNEEVAEGQVIATIDSTSAYQTVRSAQAALDSARLALEKLKEPASTISLLQTRNSLAEAERNLAKLQPTEDDITEAQKTLDQAERDLEEIQLTTEQEVNSTIDSGYNSVVSAFLILPGLKNDLADLIGTEINQEEYIGFYNLLVSSSYTEKLLTDYYQAENSLDTAWVDYLSSSQSSDRDFKADLAEQTLDAAIAISDAVNDAQNLLDSLNTVDYSHSAVADHIDEMTSIISADVSQANSVVSSIQNSVDSIDRINLSAPYDLADAEETVEEAEQALAELLAGPDADDLASAEESVAEKTQQLTDLEAGTDENDLRDQELVIEQKQNTLTAAYEDLAKYLIRAPAAGVVTSLSFKRGDSVSTGTTVGTLISKEKVAIVSLNEVDIAKIKIGDKAILTFDAIEDLEISGRVISTDLIGTESQGVVTYDVHILFDSQDENIRPGMSVTTDIITDVKTNTLMVANSAVKNSNGVDYVETFDEVSETSITTTETPKKIQIEIGLSNDTQTEILSGLSEGDMVITKTASASASSSKTTSSSSQSGSLMMGSGGPPGF